MSTHIILINIWKSEKAAVGLFYSLWNH